jgi:HSP20 family protein
MNGKALMSRETEKDLEMWDPLREFRARPFGGLFEDLFAPMKTVMPAMPKAWMPRVDVQETEKEYVLSMSLPGVRKEDVKLDVKGDLLTISGERKAEKEEKGKTWLRRESSYGSFLRSFILPEGLHPEDVKASHKDGVLTVTMRKPAEAAPKGVRIAVE